MPGYERVQDRAAVLGRDIRLEAGRQLRVARLSNGLSQAAVAKAAGVSTALVSRIERGLVVGVSVAVLARLFAAVGLRLSVKAYPDGDAVRDGPQNRVLARFRALLPPDAPWRTEVPLPIPGDRRAWDAWTRLAGVDFGVEVESAVTDSQAVTRRSLLKARDGRMDRVVLVLADTRRNREALAAAEASFRSAFPVTRGEFLRAVREGRDPGGNALLLV